MNKIAKNERVFVLLYLVCIVYITLLSRSPNLVTHLRTVPLWSYVEWFSGNWERGKSILLNVILFIPFGYLLVDEHGYRSLIIVILLSGMIEITQFYLKLGLFDIDDLVSNTAGGLIGIMFRCLIGNRIRNREIACILTLVVGIIGCSYTYANRKSPRYIDQFNFRVTSIDDGTIYGNCYVYGFTPTYRIIFKADDGRKTVADTDITGDSYKARVDLCDGVKYEMLVQFDGYQPISTVTWLRNNFVEYVPGELPDLPDVSKTALLKAYSSQFDTFVYQDGSQLIWLIGDAIDASTEIIYHIHTTEPEKLPEHRMKYGFDNRGFTISAQLDTKTTTDGKYKVFVKEIPSEFNVTSIVVGFNSGGRVVWEDSFRIFQ